MKNQNQKVLLLILDGWGINHNKEVSAIEAATKPNYDKLLATCPNTQLNASGVYVGLPDGIMGNSEVGHENIGSGRINKQKLTQISDLVKTGEFFQNQVLINAFEHAKTNNSKIHLMGLISEGDVHAHLGHLDALIDFAHKVGLRSDQVFLHAISDGRDDPPYVAERLMKRYEARIQIATVSGRYWAMDRDNNWDRIQKYLDCVIAGKGLRSSSGSAAITDGYALAKQGGNPTGNSDEFILPTIIDDRGLVGDNDSVIFFNFRPDRAKQISKKIGKDAGFKNFLYTCFAEYGDDLNLPIAFTEKTLPKQDFSMTLGELVANAGMKQFRTAETEKYNHVTMFFNSRKKDPYLHEERLLIPSPKVATYDLKPEMSIYEVTDGLLEAIAKKEYDLIVCNYANPDMVGHTGVWNAVVKAITVVDECLGKVADKAKENDYVLMVTADHGNADQMFDNDAIRTAHSCNQVPFIIYNSKTEIKLRPSITNPQDIYASSTLANIAPTVLEYLGLEKPKQMLASSLIVNSTVPV